MTDQRIIAHKHIMMTALSASVVALPFSIKMCHGAIIILLINWAAEGGWRAKLTIIKQSLLLQLLIAFFIIQVIGLIFSDSFLRGWFSVEKRIFFLLLPIALATSAVRLTATELRNIMFVFMAACLAGTIVCAFDAWQATKQTLQQGAAVNTYLATSPYSQLHADASDKWLFMSYVSLSGGIGIHPTYFSLYLTFCISFLLTQFPIVRSPLPRVGIVILILYLTVFIVFLSARIMIVGLAIIYAVALVSTVRRGDRVRTAAALGVIGFLAFVLYLNPVSRYRNLQEIKASTFDIQPGNHYTNAAQIRVSLWWLGVSCLPDLNPLYGSGTGDVEKVMSHASEKYQITNIIESFDPHNQFLYTAMANGIIGLAILILLLLLPGYLAWMHRDLLMISFLFLFLILCLTESALEVQKGIVFYALVSGLIFFQSHSFQGISLNLRSLLRAGQ